MYIHINCGSPSLLAGFHLAVRSVRGLARGVVGGLHKAWYSIATGNDLETYCSTVLDLLGCEVALEETQRGHTH